MTGLSKRTSVLFLLSCLLFFAGFAQGQIGVEETLVTGLVTDDTTPNPNATTNQADEFEAPNTQFGVGIGIFCVIIALIIGIFLMFLYGSNQNPYKCIFLGLSLPLIVLFIVMVIPAERTGTDADETTNSYFYPKWSIFTFVLVALLLTCCSKCCANLSRMLMANRVDSSSTMKEEDDDKNLDEDEILLRKLAQQEQFIIDEERGIRHHDHMQKQAIQQTQSDFLRDKMLSRGLPTRKK
eukprot:CAMPEP_0115044604 /NCGR_PEP_ID=MMETSP0216-20121206/47613_1 /TAXON_ID=223996 /ORGANISM="Protocruzia adherens, Strain Boccale" /LENGTH=238 /DNA_ID=CAMNT_0002427247 /DNA_START=15 /DNA_END=731 /DNA_ORIENTATION=-